MPEQKYIPLSNSYNADRPEENLEVGPWNCKCSADEENFGEFLEMHLSHPGTGIVFRVSRYLLREIRLGECAILDKTGAIALRNRLNKLIEQLP